MLCCSTNHSQKNKNKPLLTAMGRTKCLDITGGLEMSAISMKPTISKSETKTKIYNPCEDLFHDEKKLKLFSTPDKYLC